MEYGGPLHRRTMQLLAHDAVTEFRVHGIGADVISNRSAVAARFVPGLEIHIVGAREEFFEFIHVSVSLVGREVFSMRVCTWNDECPSTVKSHRGEPVENGSSCWGKADAIRREADVPGVVSAKLQPRHYLHADQRKEPYFGGLAVGIGVPGGPGAGVEKSLRMRDNQKAIRR
jgi:hypothetical protein